MQKLNVLNISIIVSLVWELDLTLAILRPQHYGINKISSMTGYLQLQTVIVIKSRQSLCLWIFGAFYFAFMLQM